MNEIKCNIFDKTYNLPLDKVYAYMQYFGLPTTEEFEKDVERVLTQRGTKDINQEYLLKFIDISDQVSETEDDKLLDYVISESIKNGEI